MIKKYIPYSWQVLKLNLIVTPIATFFGTILSKSFSEKGASPDSILYLFMISFLGGGFLLGVLYFELTKSREYYFYYNLGISKLKLVLMTYLYHIILSIPIIILARYAELL